MAPALHVLLVEDDPLTVIVVERILRACPHVATVTVATDGRDALDRLLAGGLGSRGLVVLTDLGMPRMTGLELIAAIRQEPTLAALPVLILTTSGDAGDRQAASALGVAGYFLKSTEDRTLRDVRAWLQAHRTAGTSPPAPPP